MTELRKVLNTSSTPKRASERPHLKAVCPSQASDRRDPAGFPRTRLDRMLGLLYNRRARKAEGDQRDTC